MLSTVITYRLTDEMADITNTAVAFVKEIAEVFVANSGTDVIAKPGFLRVINAEKLDRDATYDF